MTETDQARWQKAKGRFARGLVSEDFADCSPFVALIEDQPTASVELAEVFGLASKAWASEVANELGNYLRDHQGTKHALSFYRLALRAGLDVRLNLANLLSDVPGEWEEAERLYRDVIVDGDPDALNNLAQLLTNRGASFEAEALYKRAVREKDSLARRNYAMFLLEEDRFDDAEEQLRQLGKEVPAEGLPRLAAFLANVGRWPEAVGVLGQMRGTGLPVSATLLRLSDDPNNPPAKAIVRRAFGAKARDTFEAMRYGQRRSRVDGSKERSRLRVIN